MNPRTINLDRLLVEGTGILTLVGRFGHPGASVLEVSIKPLFIEHTRGEFYWRDDGGHFFAKQNARVWAYGGRTHSAAVMIQHRATTRRLWGNRTRILGRKAGNDTRPRGDANKTKL